jgi:dihydroxy-acid dehydratase
VTSQHESRDPSRLRSNRWFGRDDLRSFAHRQRMQQIGLDRSEFLGKPIVAILNSWNALSTCHSHLPDRAKAVARGILGAGGFPVEFPVLSLSEVMVKPTTMLYRNLLAMEVEEVLRSHPFDAAVLLGGCDKTAPGMLMGAFSLDFPVIFVPAGPMINGQWRGEKVGAGTHTRIFWDQYRAGDITQEDWIKLESSMTRSAGTCNTMGTASTMALAIEALGLSLPGAATIPAVDADHERMVSRSGSVAVDLAWKGQSPSRFISRESFLNAITVVCACGGSTNAVIHLIAMARRMGVELNVDDFDRVARQVPLLVNLMPAGEKLMADFFYAGGLPSLMKRIPNLLNLTCKNLMGERLESLVAAASQPDPSVIRTLDDPVTTEPAIAVLRGNLAPLGAIIKPSTFGQRFLQHTGPALVFEGAQDFAERIDSPDLIVTADTVLVLRSSGPVGAPGMPEWGNLSIPKQLLAQGVKNMLRISDARMSGTHFGACVLHISPESAAGGPLAIVRTGDMISLDFLNRRIDLHLSDQEIEQRLILWREQPKLFKVENGYVKLFQDHVNQATEGCDFDFLVGRRDRNEPEIF